MAKGKMDLSTFVGKLLEEQDGDVLREGIACSPRRSWRARWPGSSARSGLSIPRFEGEHPYVWIDATYHKVR